MRRFKWIAAALAVAITAMLCLPLDAFALENDQSYSFTYDEWQNPIPAPAPYEVRYTIDTNALGLGQCKEPQGLFVWQKEKKGFICDTGNSRIIELDLSKETATVVRTFGQAEDGSAWSLSKPYDIFVTDDGTMYIADMGNERVLVVSYALEMLREIKKPESTLFDAFSYFRPMKLVVTAGGRIYVQAQGVNKGLMEFSAEGEFSGYMGASTVNFDWADYIWKAFLSTNEQKAQMETFTPTEYNNVAIDNDGFIFATTSVYEVNDPQKVVRRLNLKGTNILVEKEKVIGARKWTAAIGPSRFIDVTVLPDNTYYVLDSNQQLIYAYDEQGYFLYAFGGYGNRGGYFLLPRAIEHCGKDLLVLDAQKNTVSVLKQTEYGANISNAIESYNSGNYSESFDSWNDVLKMNGNYTLAYSGIGRILLRDGKYEEALAYLKYAKNTFYYSKAFQLYRQDWAEKYLAWIIGFVVIAVVIAFIAKRIMKVRREVGEYERSQTERNT